MTNQHRLTLASVSVALTAFTGSAWAQHYPLGVEGIKGASVPPPGVYLRDYNVGYFASTFQPNTPPDFDISAYVNAPRLIWMTPTGFLGANYGMSALLPISYTHVSAGGYDGESFGIGDLMIEPIILAWHLKQFDIGAGYALWTPTGEFDAMEPDSPGLGYFGNMITLGATWYPDAAKTWSVSLLNRYEINFENPDTDITTGQNFTVEWGIAKTLNKTIDVGVIGYYRQQVTDDSGNTTYDTSQHQRVVGVGPEVAVAFPEQMFFVSLRYAREFAADLRPEGNNFILTLTKRF